MRAANALGRAQAALGRPRPRLDEQALLAAARRRTGLEDFGDPRFREPLAIFLRALDEEAELSFVGRWLARHEVRTWLENRLEIEETFRRHPDIANEAIPRPLFVTGSGRSGTSILHELLAQDPRNRVLRSWEALHPCPPPERGSCDRDPRIRRAEREVRLWARIAPIYETMHENGAELPQECIYLTAHEFASDLLSGWALKAPSHLWALDALLDVYPDARIVWTHRDPLAVVASMTSLMTTLLWLRSDRVDAAAVGQGAVRSIGFMLKRAMALRDAAGLGPDRICDVRYQDFLADPIAAVARVYAHFEIPLHAEAEARMRAYLAARPRQRHGAHTWRFDWTGLDPDEARRRFAPYRERFGVPAEL